MHDHEHGCCCGHETPTQSSHHIHHKEGHKTKIYILEGLDCANCAAKMEHAIGKLTGVEAATVNFLTQKMTLQFADSADETMLLEQVKKCIRKVDPDCEVLG